MKKQYEEEKDDNFFELKSIEKKESGNTSSCNC